MRVTTLLTSLLIGLAIVEHTHHVCSYCVPRISSRLPGWNLGSSSRHFTPPHQKQDESSSTRLGFSTTDVSRGTQDYFAGDEEDILNTYEEWRKEYAKGDFDNLRYQNFRANYIKLMTANAAELTVARDLGYPDPIPLALNEYGDLSPDEFNNLKSGQSPPSNNGYQNPQGNNGFQNPQSNNGYQNPQSNNGFQNPQSNNGYQNPQSNNGYQNPQSAVPNTNNGANEQDRIRQIYQEWCVINQKVYDESRLPIFTTNLQVVENFYKATGKKAELNEYADLSPEEYQAIAMSGGQQAGNPPQQNPHLENMSTHRQTPPSTLHQYFDEAEVNRIRQAYQEWCTSNRKQYNEARLDIFATNLLAIESFRAETGKNAVLNEYADLAPDEYAMANDSSVNNQGSGYLDSLSSAPEALVDQGIRAVYQDWCVYYEKAPSEEGLLHFTQNYLAIEKHYRETGEELTMDQYSDLPSDKVPQEFEIFGSEEKNRVEEERKRAEEERRLEEAEKELRLEEARLKEKQEEERLAEETILQEKAEEERRLEALRLEQEAAEQRTREETARLKEEENERMERARRNEEERKKAVEMLRIEEERKQKEEEAQRQKQEEERAKFEEATRRVEEAQQLEQTRAAAAAQAALEERRAIASGEVVQETSDLNANPRFSDLDVEKERLRKERLELEESLASDRARLQEEKRREEEAKAALEETNRQIDELMKENEKEEDERPDPIILPRGSYMDAVAKTWVDRSAYLQALQEGRAGALPYNPQYAEKKPEAQVEQEKQEIKKSESLINSIWNFMKESSIDDTWATQSYSNNLIRQADQLISDTSKKSTGVTGEELQFLKQAVDAMRRRNNDEIAADQARIEAKEWEKIQKGLEKEAKLAKQRREHDERIADEARRKARSLESEHRKQKKRAEEARRQEKRLNEQNKQTAERIRELDPAFGNPAFGNNFEGQENPFGFFSNPFQGDENKENIFSFFGGSETNEERNAEPVTSMTQPVTRTEKKVSWLDAVFGFLAGEEPEDETPGLGTITLEPAKRTSVFDLFVSPESIEPVREPGRGSITIDDTQESSIFSFFARFGISNKKEKFIDPVRRKRVMDYENKLKSRQEKLSRLKAGRSRILGEKDKKLSRKEARKLQRELDELAVGDSTSTSRSFNIPQLVKWTRTPDGRITGWISDSSGGKYKMGTKITTSPIKGNVAKPGMTVTTTSGSQYRLGLSAARRTLDATSDSINTDERSSQSSPLSSIFGGWFNEEVVPSLVEWTQNEDGTITGFVNNKEGFEDGTQITTSPVPKGARKGMIIQTKGGSKYKLMRQKRRTTTYDSPSPPPF